MFCSLLSSNSTWPEDSNSILCPILNFQSSHFIWEQNKTFIVAFGNKTGALCLMSLKSASRRVCYLQPGGPSVKILHLIPCSIVIRTVFQLSSLWWRQCPNLSVSFLHCKQIPRHLAKAFRSHFFQRTPSFWRFQALHLLEKKMVTYPTWLTKCINKSLVLYWLKISLAQINKNVPKTAKVKVYSKNHDLLYHRNYRRQFVDENGKGKGCICLSGTSVSQKDTNNHNERGESM